MRDDNTMREQERIQRALNEAKKEELSKKFGATFGEGGGKLPAELESQWLHNIEEFELQHENAKYVTVREYVGNPEFKPPDQISPDQLAEEFDKIIDLLARYNIAVDFIHEQPDDVAYEFLTNELMDAEIEDLHLPGWTTNFIYEEFHPNDEDDAELFADHFLWDLFEQKEDYALLNTAKDELYDRYGNRITQEEMKKMIIAFYADYAAFTAHEFICIQCNVDGDYATVTFDSKWTGLKPGSSGNDSDEMESVSHTGKSVLRMKRSPYGGFDVIQANVIGWE